MEDFDRKPLEIKKRLIAAGIDYEHLVYMPLVPTLGFISNPQFVLSEEYGMKVARLITAGDD